ncbi:MAG: acetyl-CoA hydrolase/transferase C-terminal domain-containing protein [Anaerovoracaceae bacterium]
MNKYIDQYKEKLMTVADALTLLKTGDYVFCGEAAAEPAEILREFHTLKDMNISNVILNTCISLEEYPLFTDIELGKIVTHKSGFFGGPQRRANKLGLVSFIPQHTTNLIRNDFDRIASENRRSVLMTTVSPMNEQGYFSLSTSALYEKDLVDKCDTLILEVNENFPRTYGDTLVHISQIDGLVESSRPVPTISSSPFTEVDSKIASHIASLVEDGSTIQLGIGNIPNAVAVQLKTKKHLGIHTEMFTESMMELLESGAVDNSAKGFNNGVSIAAFTMGSEKLYKYLDNNEKVQFKSSLYTNDPYLISKNNKYVSINSTLQVDLNGQCASETIGSTQFSGTGGQVDTMIGAQMSPGGKSIIATHSTFTKKDKSGNIITKSKIASILDPGSIVTATRNNVDYIVTEYGVAWIRGATIKERTKSLISIAHPDFRESLTEEATKLGLLL